MNTEEVLIIFNGTIADKRQYYIEQKYRNSGLSDVKMEKCKVPTARFILFRFVGHQGLKIECGGQQQYVYSLIFSLFINLLCPF